MAKAVKRASCSTCGKENGQVTCEGCSKVYCLNDFNGHRQELGEQLDAVEVTRDVFRQSLTEKVSDPRKHSLIERINQWENDSINKIRQAAEESRQILFRHTSEINKTLEDKLKKLTDQLRKGREKNEFSELDLDNWKEQLKQMRNELDNPSTITILQSSTPIVTKITVSISDKRGSTISSMRTDAISKNTHAPDQTVFCAFCDDEFNSIDAMTDHLMMCGNKTDQCPNCRKYVRRAIFVYHSDNNCANPDDPVTNDRKYQSAQYNVRTRVTSDCQFCGYYFDNSDINEHKKNCLQNPANRQQPQLSTATSVDLPVATCMHCGSQRALQGLVYHQLVCRMNPHRKGNS